jgi:hypothetical protein
VVALNEQNRFAQVERNIFGGLEKPCAADPRCMDDPFRNSFMVSKIFSQKYEVFEQGIEPARS